MLELVMFGDVALCSASLAVAYALNSHRAMPAILLKIDISNPVQRFISLVALGILWHISLTATGMYRSHRLARFSQEAGEIGKSTLATSVCVLAWCWLRPRSAMQPLAWDLEIVSIFGILTFSGLMLTRIAGRNFTHLLRLYGRNLRNVLIVGSNRRATDFAHDIEIHPQWGYQLMGFVDDTWYCAETRDPDHERLLGCLDRMPEFLRTLALDEVVVALPMASYYKQAAWIVSLCKQQGIQVRFAGGLFDLQAPNHLRQFNDESDIITLWDQSWDSWSAFLKRSIDIVFSAAILLACLPVLIAIAIATRMSSQGPVFFAQDRLGAGKRHFKMIKFRTMVAGAEALLENLEHLNESDGPTFKLKNDPRITPLGSFLRKTSLDELPQLINVFIGDMSLVGPRPLPLRDYNGFSEDWHRRRFSVKPGITCLWQISGRSSIGFEEWMELDLNYIDHWSIWLDFKILLRTIPAVLRGSGAM